MLGSVCYPWHYILKKLTDIVTGYQPFLALHHIVPRVCSLVEVFQYDLFVLT